MEPPCIPVDAGDMKVQLLLGIGGGHGGMDLAAQLLEGSDDQIQILLLVGLEPTALIIESDAPQKIHGALRKTLKHRKRTSSVW